MNNPKEWRWLGWVDRCHSWAGHLQLAVKRLPVSADHPTRTGPQTEV